MRVLYLDCGMGAAGDMLTAALLELVPDKDKFIEELNGLGIPGVEFAAQRSVKSGITGTHMSVTVGGEEETVCDYHDHEHVHDHNHDHDHDHEHHHDDHDHDQDHKHDHDHNHNHDHHHHDHEHSHEHHHEHNSLHNIEHLVNDHLSLKDNVKQDILDVYRLIAEAEGRVHNADIHDIHFHEVGTMDAVADVTAVCMLIDKLGVDKIVVSPVHVGSGKVKCAHGILPVPAPATAHILKNVPIYSGQIKGELCTPTGAALLKHFATEFASMPVMEPIAIGYGMGKKDFEVANCVRAILGNTVESLGHNENEDAVYELSCNLDDMTGEQIGFAIDMLLSEGALDVYTIAIGMKKSRPGVMLNCLCRQGDVDKMSELIFKHTTTLGIRKNKFDRYILPRSEKIVDTQYGKVRVKSSKGTDFTRSKAEFDDISAIAKQYNMSLEDVRKTVEAELCKE